MPYYLEKQPGGYIVVNKATGRHYSLSPIPKARAEAQLRLLEAIKSKEKK